MLTKTALRLFFKEVDNPAGAVFFKIKPPHSVGNVGKIVGVAVMDISVSFILRPFWLGPL